MGQANDMRPWRPSENTKVIEILLGPDFHEPGKTRTVDDAFVRDGNTFKKRTMCGGICLPAGRGK